MDTTSLELAARTIPAPRAPTPPSEDEIVECEERLQRAYDRVHQPASAKARTVRPGKAR